MDNDAEKEGERERGGKGVIRDRHIWRKLERESNKNILKTKGSHEERKKER